MARKAITTISVSGIGSGMGLVSAAPEGTYSTEADSISAYGDPWETNVPRSEGKSFGDLSFQFLDEGAAVNHSIVGTVVSVTITPQFGDGKGGAASRAKTFDFVVKGVSSGEVSVDGERKATITITGVQHTEAAASSGN